MRSFLAATFGSLLLTGFFPVGARTWTDTDGRTVEADYVSHDEDQVVMLLEGGKQATVELSRLSEADRKFLSEQSGQATGARKTSLNWDDPWPEMVVFGEDPSIEVVEEDEAKGRYVYTSENYRFICDVRLSKSVVSTFADMFEATHLFCRMLPLALDGGKRQDGRHNILLFETEESYISAGGPPESAGVFIPSRNLVMVPLTSLGVRAVGSSYMRDRDKDDSTLVHELVHQLTPEEYFQIGARGWFSEGLAEYCATTPYRSGRFKVRSNLDEITDYLVGYGKEGTGGRALGEEIVAPPLKDFMIMSYADFGGAKSNFNYGFSLLLTTYFFLFDGDGDAARIKEFLKELRSRKTGGDPTAALAKLLDGRSWDELEEDVAKSWRRKGIKIEFRD